MARRGAAAGVRTRGAAPRVSADVATDREVSVVAAVLAAGSEKSAAHRLGLSHSTVKHHLASARSKVGAETMAQLVWILRPRLQGPEAREAVAERPIASGLRAGGALPVPEAEHGSRQRVKRGVGRCRRHPEQPDHNDYANDEGRLDQTRGRVRQRASGEDVGLAGMEPLDPSAMGTRRRTPVGE